MKYGKVLTYKEVKEAKKLVGKAVVAKDEYYLICETPEHCYLHRLDHFDDFDSCRFVMDNGDSYQFIREVINELECPSLTTEQYTTDGIHYKFRVKKEPKYRPFNSVDELIEHWENNYGNKNRPHGTMPLIWVKSKSTGNRLFLTAFFALEVGNGEDIYSMNQLLKDFTFLDGKPCAVEVVE